MRKHLGGFVVLMIKLGPKFLSILAKMAKALKVGKVGLAAGSMAGYTYLLSWQFALMIMVLLFVHESGHIWAMKRCGLKTKGIYFVPFLGAAAVSEDQFPSRRVESFIAIMGPIWGLLFSLVVALVYVLTQKPIFAAAAGWMAMINLFNLLPINPLDGGRIFKSIAFSIDSRLGFVFLIVGSIACFCLSIYVGAILFSVLLVFGLLELLDELAKNRRARMIRAELIYEGYPENGLPSVLTIPKMSPSELVLSFVSYGLVSVALWQTMAYLSHVPGAKEAFDVLKG